MSAPELLAPGGSFLAAHYAFQAGADGVYLGLREFSARKAAANFTLEQLRRILGVARAPGDGRQRRVYLALNTVVREEELERAAEALFWAESLGVDGVIVQDLGVSELVRRHFPRLALHASTQMAVHDLAGLRELRRLGFQRAILARELTLEEIRGLGEAQSGVELEVFVHGALCYSVSGLCLASWALTGRSGNRGECAQICRSLFRVPPEEGGEEGHFFSCRDLNAGREITRLRHAGVGAFKIEGRMKSPEYVTHVVRLYRALIDRGESLPPPEYEALQRQAALAFARQPTRGYLHDPRGEDLLNPGFPGHRGVPLGRVQSLGRDPLRLRLRLEGPLSLRDGLGYFPSGRKAEPVAFSVRAILKGGREVPVAQAGDTVEVPLPHPAPEPAPAVGQTIVQLSSRQMDLPQPKEGGFPPWKIPFEADFRLSGPAAEGGAGTLEVRLRSLNGRPAKRGQGPDALPAFVFRRELPLERAATPRAFLPILQGMFEQSGDSPLGLAPAPTRLENATALGDAELFVPPSALKQAKNACYAALAQWFDAYRQARVGAARGDPATEASEAQAALPSGPAPAALARRQDLSPLAPAAQREDGATLFPFISASRAPRLGQLREVEGWTALPLPPVARGGLQGLLPALRELLAAHPRRRFLIGLSNLGHLQLVDALGAVPNAAFFVDFPMYVANRFAFAFFARRVPRLLFQYFWIEGASSDEQRLRAALAEGGAAAAAHPRAALLSVGPGFRPPLFYALCCPVGQQALGDPRRGGARGCASGEGCSRRIDVPLLQGRKRFRLEVRDCLACLYEAPQGIPQEVDP